jgi:dUTP pyrophosphatase
MINGTLEVTLLHEDARCPHQASIGSAGYDLICPMDHVIPPYSTAVIPLWISIGFPNGYYGLMRSRSSIAAKGVHVGAGVLDNDYHGMISAVLTNTTEKDFVIKKFSRIAQFVLLPLIQMPVSISLCYPYASQQPNIATLPPPPIKREGGFGSTGI